MIKNSILLFLIVITSLTILNASLLTKEIVTYTNLFITKLFPSNFLFFTLSSLLINYNIIEKISKLLHHNGSTLFVTIMSLISGYPSGSIYIKKLLNENLITTKKANYLIKFTHFPNPIFILGPVSLLFKNKIFPTKILLSLILSNFIIALIFYRKEKDKEIIYKTSKNSFSKNLTNAITSSFKVIITIYGISLFFFIIGKIITLYLNLEIIPYILISGIFDLTNGIFKTSLITNDILKAIIIIIFFSLGGISVNMQIKSIISDTNIKYKNFFLARLLQLLLATIIFLWIV